MVGISERWIILDRVVLLLFAAVLAIAVAALGDSRGAGAQDAPRSIPATKSNSMQLAVGDRVKITFFEILDIPATAGDDRSMTGEGASVPMRSFFQRMDLTGEYAVEFDGSISIPRIGTFDAARRTVTEVQSKLANAFEQTMSRSCDVAITIVDRQPVYVMGAARQPGAYKYTPGLMVLQALALAGGLERQAERASRVIDILREQERQAAIAARLKRLLAQKVRLEGERDGATEIRAPKRLQGLANADEIAALIQSEMAALKQRQRAFEEENVQNAAAIGAVQREISAIQERRSKGLHLVAMRQKRVEEMSSLSKRGSVSGPALTMVKTELAQIASDVEETALLKVQAQQRLQQAERNATRTARERETRIESELAVNAEEIIHAERDLASAQRITETMAADGTNVAKAAGAGIQVTYEIVRRQGGEEATTIAADELTRLAPGDILRVKLGPAEARDSEDAVISPHSFKQGDLPPGH